jgi:hypothetical protein
MGQVKRSEGKVSPDPRCTCGHPRSVHADCGCMNPEWWQCSCKRFRRR